MTAPTTARVSRTAPMIDEEIVAALAEVLAGRWLSYGEDHHVDDLVEHPDRDGARITATHAPLLAAALLPTVRHIAEQRAAEELEAASAAYWRDVTFPIARYPEVRDWLRDRAAALTATPNHGTDAT